jgi:NAD(P)-dependent dehydrogenase (short-subunit alcohol dehydrogenase family)
MNRLSGKVAAVTGAGAGIGEAIALRFAMEGASVVVAEIETASGEATVGRIAGDAGTSAFIRVDATSPTDVEAMIRFAEETYGGLDILVNNADAGHSNPDARLEEMPIDHFEQAILGELLPAFLGMKYALPAMRRRGGGAVINLGSDAALAADYGLVGHDVGKAAIVSLTRWAAVNYAREGIRVNAICPGPTLTSASAQPFGMPAVAREMESAIPMGRIARPDEQAHVAVFLASDEASYVNGVALPVDGGLMAALGIRLDWTKPLPA